MSHYRNSAAARTRVDGDLTKGREGSDMNGPKDNDSDNAMSGGSRTSVMIASGAMLTLALVLQQQLW